VPASDKRIKFLGGLDAVSDAGGEVIRDLFESDGGHAADSTFVDKLVADKLDGEAGAIRAEGWKWVETRVDMDWSILQDYRRTYPSTPELTEDQQTKLDELEKAAEAAANHFDEDGSDEAYDIYNAADAALEAFNAQIAPVFSDAQKAQAGCIVTVHYDGELRIERGLIHPDDQTKTAPQTDGAKETEAAPAPLYTKALTEDLTAQKTAALRVELSRKPIVALAASVHAMALDAFYGARFSRDAASSLQVTSDSEDLGKYIKENDTCAPMAQLERMHEDWRNTLPANPADLWSWCLAQAFDTLLSLNAYLVARSVNAVESGEGYNAKGVAHGDDLARALDIDMADHFEATDTGFFGRLKLAGIQACLSDALGESAAEAVAGMKKKEAATYAAQKIKNTNWLPELIRYEPNDHDPNMQEAASA